MSANKEKVVAPEEGAVGKGDEKSTGKEKEKETEAPADTTTTEESASPSSIMSGLASLLGAFGKGRFGKGSSSSGLGKFGLGSFGKSGFGKSGSSSSGLGELLGSFFGGGGQATSGDRASSSAGGGLAGLMSGLTGGAEDTGDITCKKVSLLFARGTTEPGTMGFSVGPMLAEQLRKAYPNDVFVKGIPYPGM